MAFLPIRSPRPLWSRPPAVDSACCQRGGVAGSGDLTCVPGCQTGRRRPPERCGGTPCPASWRWSVPHWSCPPPEAPRSRGWAPATHTLRQSPRTTEHTCTGRERWPRGGRATPLPGCGRRRHLQRGLELPDSQVLQDPPLQLVQGVVVLVQQPASRCDVQAV